MRRVARVAGSTFALAMVLLLAGAAPASAHTVSGVGATNWVTAVTSVHPAVAGLQVKAVELGSRLEITNTGPEITVLGYDGEPYLRIGPQGVFENLSSPATYLNRTRAGTTPIPADLPTDPNAPPVWQKISSGHLARYHDHRIHWMGTSPPPDVQRAPGQVHVRPPWQVMMRQGSTSIVVTGSLTWIPGPSPWPWLAAAAAVAVVVAMAGRLRWWGVLLAASTGVVLVSDIVHAIGIAGVASGGAGYVLGKFVFGSYYSFIGWVLGVVAVVLLIRSRIDGLYAAVFTGVSALLFSGVLDVSTLHRSHAPFVWGISADRITVVVALGGGLGLAVGALWALRRSSPLESDGLDHDDPEVDHPTVDLVPTLTTLTEDAP